MLDRSTLKPLTSLRFFAAASVVVFHLGPHIGIHTSAWLANGVSFFFVLSGFILTYVHSRDGAAKAAFYWARFARIWPTHFLSFLIFIAVTPVGWVWATGGGFGIALINLALLQSWVPSQAYALSFNSVSWTLSVELLFYAVFPFIVAAKRFGLLYGLVAAATLAALAFAAVIYQGEPAGPWEWSPSLFAIQNPLMRLLEFMSGILAARLYLAGTYRPFAGAEWVAVAGAGLSVLLMSTVGRMAPAPIAIWLTLAGSQFAFAAMVYVFAFGTGILSRILSYRAPVLLGEISFATYMLHGIIIEKTVEYGWAHRAPLFAH
ncbi:acyltransferase family protein [Mesorhizobium australicum]|uniref:acyltransferase family protein n=1 Tax=Mesorhizobium australicum TaxID=536018 RepID=UPI00333DA9C4